MADEEKKKTTKRARKNAKGKVSAIAASAAAAAASAAAEVADRSPVSESYKPESPILKPEEATEKIIREFSQVLDEFTEEPAAPRGSEEYIREYKRRIGCMRVALAPEKKGKTKRWRYINLQLLEHVNNRQFLIDALEHAFEEKRRFDEIIKFVLRKLPNFPDEEDK